MFKHGFTISLPPFYCYVRSEYLYNMESHKGETIPCVVVGADSVYGRATGFDIIINNGAMFARLPVSALVHKPDAPDLPLDYLQLWNNFSYTFEIVEYLAIREAACEVILKDKNWYPGQYMFTFSWLGYPYAEDAGEGGFKRAHLIKLDNGYFALQPNNRIKFHEASFITEPFPDNPDYKTNDYNWSSEDKGKWVTENSDRYFYDIEEVLLHKDNNIKPICLKCLSNTNVGLSYSYDSNKTPKVKTGWHCFTCHEDA